MGELSRQIAEHMEDSTSYIPLPGGVRKYAKDRAAKKQKDATAGVRAWQLITDLGVI
jgi:hypothetical protein